MTKYVKAPKEETNVAHLTNEHGEPRCGGVIHHEPLDEDEFEDYRVCKQCSRGWDHVNKYLNLTEDILELTEDEWLNAVDLALELDVDQRPVRRRLNELHQVGKLNRRGGLANKDGSKGYEYSQQSMPQTSYEENNNLFESMLNGD